MFCYRAGKTLQIETHNLLSFICIFGRRRFKERGRFLGNFYEKLMKSKNRRFSQNKCCRKWFMGCKWS